MEFIRVVFFVGIVIVLFILLEFSLTKVYQNVIYVSLKVMSINYQQHVEWNGRYW